MSFDEIRILFILGASASIVYSIVSKRKTKEEHRRYSERRQIESEERMKEFQREEAEKREAAEATRRIRESEERKSDEYFIGIFVASASGNTELRKKIRFSQL